MKKLIVESFTLVVIAMLAAGTLLHIPGLITLAVAINWVCIILALPASILMICCSVMYSNSSGKMKENIGQLLMQSARKKGILKKLYGWADVIATIALLAWSGWLITAVAYCLAVLMMQFAKSILRDEAVKHGIA